MLRTCIDDSRCVLNMGRRQPLHKSWSRLGLAYVKWRNYRRDSRPGYSNVIIIFLAIIMRTKGALIRVNLGFKKLKENYSICVQLTSMVLRHEYVVFETEYYWWSIEKSSDNNGAIIIQRSSAFDAVASKFRGKDRMLFWWKIGE